MTAEVVAKVSAKRILTYALIYATLGAALGVALALWTKDVDAQRNIILESMRKRRYPAESKSTDITDTTTGDN